MSLVAIDARGRHTARSTETAPEVRHVYQTTRTAEPAVRPRQIVPMTPRRRRT